MEKAAVFIDGNNLYEGLKHCYHIERLDIIPFCEYLTKGKDLVLISYTDSSFIQDLDPEKYSKQQSYFAYLKKSFKNTPAICEFRKGYFKDRQPPVEKLADVFTATDLVNFCYKEMFDVAYLVSGDADLSPAVDIVTIQRGKRVFNVYFDNSIRKSYALRSKCQGFFINITKKLAESYEWVHKKEPEPCDSGDHSS